MDRISTRAWLESQGFAFIVNAAGRWKWRHTATLTDKWPHLSEDEAVESALLYLFTGRCIDRSDVPNFPGGPNPRGLQPDGAPGRGEPWTRVSVRLDNYSCGKPQNVCVRRTPFAVVWPGDHAPVEHLTDADRERILERLS